MQPAVRGSEEEKTNMTSKKRAETLLTELCRG